MTTEAKPETTLSLLKKRELLRLEMRIQRQIIAQRLGPERQENTGYPRSQTMRFLTERPALVAKIALQLATVFAGAGFVKSMTSAIGVARIFR